MGECKEAKLRWQYQGGRTVLRADKDHSADRNPFSARIPTTLYPMKCSPREEMVNISQDLRKK